MGQLDRKPTDPRFYHSTENDKISISPLRIFHPESFRNAANTHLAHLPVRQAGLQSRTSQPTAMFTCRK